MLLFWGGCGKIWEENILLLAKIVHSDWECGVWIQQFMVALTAWCSRLTCWLFPSRFGRSCWADGSRHSRIWWHCHEQELKEDIHPEISARMSPLSPSLNVVKHARDSSTVKLPLVILKQQWQSLLPYAIQDSFWAFTPATLVHDGRNAKSSCTQPTRLWVVSFLCCFFARQDVQNLHPLPL